MDIEVVIAVVTAMITALSITMITAKTTAKTTAAMKATGVVISTEGERYLGGAVGNSSFVRQYGLGE